MGQNDVNPILKEIDRLRVDVTEEQRAQIDGPDITVKFYRFDEFQLQQFIIYINSLSKQTTE